MGAIKEEAPGLIDEQEAARMLGLSPQTLSNWRCTRKVSIPFVRVGRAIRYRLADIGEFISENTFGGAVAKKS